jgi:hypothetical protein
MNIVTVEGRQYDLDAVPADARTHIEQLTFLTTDLAKMLVPPIDLPAKLESTRVALAQALAAGLGQGVVGPEQ